MKIEAPDSIIIIEPSSQNLDEIKVIFEKEQYDKLYYVVQFIEAVERYDIQLMINFVNIYWTIFFNFID